MSGTVKNIAIRSSSVHLYLTESESELDADDDYLNVPKESQTRYIGHSARTNSIAVDGSSHTALERFPRATEGDIESPSNNGSRKRKRPQIVSVEEIGKPEATSRCSSPEIPYAGGPVHYKIRKSKGQLLILKVPMNNQRTRSKKCSERDIAEILDSESDDDVLFDSVQKNGVDVVGSLPETSKNAERIDGSRGRIANRVGRSSRSSSKDVVRRTPRHLDTSDEEKEEEERVSLRLKLRRSTEQSNYKVQTIFDNEEGTRRSSRRSKVATPKKCALGDCREDDHAQQKKLQTPSKSSTSSTVRKRPKVLWEPMEVVKRPLLNGERLSAYGESDYQRDNQRLSEILEKGKCIGANRLGVTTPPLRNAAGVAPTPRSLRARRNSRQINYNEHDYDDIYKNLDKENQSENDLEDDSDSVPGRDRPRRQSSRSVVKTPRKERQILEQPSTSKRISSNSVPPDIEEDSGSVTPRGRKRQQLSRSAVGTPQTERQISEEPSSPKRTPRHRALPDAQQNTSNCKTPRTSSLRQIREEPGTPTTPRGTPGGKRTSRLVNTPSMTRGNLTPSMSRRTANVHKPITVLGEARAKLHVSAVPKSLPCREQEFNDIYQFLERKLLDNNGGCIYISGVPGTGKTATVNEAIRCLKKLVAKGDLENFDFVEINGMKLSEPRQAYVQILKQITGETASWEHAYGILDTRFTRSSGKRPMMLLLVDELDLLCTKRQDVVYNLLDWPAKENARLVVITIANTMDLPERVLMGRVTSRLGLTRLTFQPYNYKQLKEIVMARLKDSDAFKSDAIELVARKVGAVSGDARRALDICRRATEIAESSGEKIVSMKDVNEALREMIASSKVQAIMHRSDMEKMFLRAVAAEVTRTGVEETTFANVYLQLQSLCPFEGLEVPNVTVALGICARLGASRLLVCEHSRTDIQQRILLNVSSDDLHFAMNISNIE